MKKLKYIFVRLLAAFLSFFCITAFSSCAKSDGPDVNKDGDTYKIRVVSSIFPQYDFVRAVAGDEIGVRIKSDMLLTPGSESHTFEPTLSDMSLVEKADIVILAGGEIDAWADDEILDVIPEKGKTVLHMLDMVTPLEEDEETGADGDTEYDEHVWTSIRNAEIIVKEICDAICSLDPDFADEYRANADAYIEKLAALDAKFAETVNAANCKTLVFADRFPFAYFARDYGLSYISAIKGCSSSTEASLSKVSAMCNAIEDTGVKAVLTVEFSDGLLAETIAENFGVKHLTMHSCHNVSKEDFENNVTYLDIMTSNLEILKEALYG